MLFPLLSACGLDFGRREIEVDLPTVGRTSSGVLYEDLREGSGEPVREGDRVLCHYVGALDDGTIFETSRQQGAPLEFVVGSGTVIRGWEEGVVGMRPGGIRRLRIPPELAYGDEGRGETIPPQSTLILEIEVLEARRASSGP